jgi:predicted  nucleic acid-binding Zn-ribbon protein
MHHTCNKCKTHFDHLEGEIFDSCEKCNYMVS